MVVQVDDVLYRTEVRRYPGFAPLIAVRIVQLVIGARASCVLWDAYVTSNKYLDTKISYPPWTEVPYTLTPLAGPVILIVSLLSYKTFLFDFILLPFWNRLNFAVLRINLLIDYALAAGWIISTIHVGSIILQGFCPQSEDDLRWSVFQDWQLEIDHPETIYLTAKLIRTAFPFLALSAIISSTAVWILNHYVIHVASEAGIEKYDFMIGGLPRLRQGNFEDSKV
ncbi:hypothetical protein V1514DRAFT_173786 [Lipomyces japonicus]|uniref:uncharacterized protein n=1 Tax=Lipomyces japonicus TaxID=56871 RepID=UPI0034CD09E1